MLKSCIDIFVKYTTCYNKNVLFLKGFYLNKVSNVRIIWLSYELKGDNVSTGFHATIKEDATSILNTKEIQIVPFKINSDVSIPAGQRFPNDLGSGLYMFEDFYLNQKLVADGKQCSQKYFFKFKRGSCSVIAFDIEDDCVVINLDEEDTAEKFEFLRNRLMDRLLQQAHKMTGRGIKQRANYDGLIVEYMIQHYLRQKKPTLQVDAVRCSTYTPFYGKKIRTISNIANGQEFCLRNVKLINWSKTEVV